MSSMNPNDPNFRAARGFKNPLAWVAGIIAAVLVIMLIASYVNNNRNDRYSSRQKTLDESVLPNEPLAPNTNNQDAH